MPIPTAFYIDDQMSLMRVSLVLIGAAIVASPPLPIREYRVDAGHSDIAFSIGFLGHPIRGRFDDVKETIVYATNDPPASAITVVIAVKSIATGSAHRDEHLKSPDFFDAARYPYIRFRSASFARRGDSAIMTGGLTMHGVTRTVTVPFRETAAPVADPRGSRPDVPVVAAGGIGDARGIVPALALAAEGVQMRTIFLGCEEAGSSETH